MAEPSTSKQARKFLEMKQKLEIIKEVKLGRSPQKVAQSFWISVSQVYKICKDREVIANNLKDTSTQKDLENYEAKGSTS